MKRDMELIRKILFKIEQEVDNLAVYDLEIEGYSMNQVAYHCSILSEGGYILDYDGEYGSDELNCFGISRLTWKGHDFLDNIRDDTIWNKTKNIIKKEGLPLVFDVVKSISTGIITGMIKSAIGV